MTPKQLAQFTDTVWGYYRKHGRHELPWRLDHSPYAVLVSEMMLQQTQVERVISKFVEFLQFYPTLESLAATDLASVLGKWNGLGYNRRAKYLWQTARDIQADHGGVVPRTLEALIALPGIGANTAAAIRAYAYGEPVAYIETNIRTVYLHHFFAGQIEVTDRQLLPLIEQTCDTTDPRAWYWALMDYGAYLKKQQATRKVHKNSRHYKPQSPFAGSLRQVRGAVLRLLTQGNASLPELSRQITDDRLTLALHNLQQESLVSVKNGVYSLGSTKE